MADFGDEIIIKDSAGKFKILRGGQFYDLEAQTAPKATPISKLADEILKKSGLKIEGNLKERLAEIVEVYQKDVRDKFETKNTLTRKVEAGGMGFTLEQADLAIKLVDEKRKAEKVELAPKVVVAPPIAPPPSSVVPSTVPPPAVDLPVLRAMPAGVAEFVFSPADEAEILAHRQKLPMVLAGLKPIEEAKFIDEIIRESGVALDDINHKRLKNILLTRLKDIRDGFETRETLANATAGIALASEQTEKILSAARARLQELDERLKKEQLGKVKKAIEEEKLKMERARQEAEEKVKEKMEERWEEIAEKPAVAPLLLPTELVSPPIGLRAKISAIAPPAPSSALKAVPAAAAAPGVVEEKKEAPEKMVERDKGLKVERAEMQKREEIIAKPQKAEHEGAKVEITKVAVKVEEKPKPLEFFKPVTLPVVRRPVPRKEARPRIEDIKYVPKLIGPVEELREMTLVDFRRLAVDPKEAVLKIKDKLNILEKESITKKIAGIKAWQESEISKLYLEISQESLIKGVPANQIISLRASAGQPTLTFDEFQAALELNRSLRY